jgi:hypothetical protein
MVSNIDLNSSGMVTLGEFSNAVHLNGVYLSREELRVLQQKYSDTANQINYHLMSQELGLHKESFDFIRKH